VEHEPALLADELAERDAANRLPAAVVVVDLYGQCADYDAIVPLCAQYGVPLIEDAAEALGRRTGRPSCGHVRRHRDPVVQRQQDHHHLGRRRLRLTRHERWPTGAIPGDAGAPAGRALRAHRRRLQLPVEQPACRDGPGAARAACRRCRPPAGDQRALPTELDDMSGLEFMPIAPWSTTALDGPGGWNGWLTCVTFDDPAHRDGCRRR
jgi:hypothetical protein